MADQSGVGSPSISPLSLRSARLVLLAVLLTTATPGRADAFAAADFGGTWRLSVLGTRPVGASVDSTFTAPFGATVGFDQTGTILDTTSSGRLFITDVGVVTGTLTNVVFVTGPSTNVVMLRSTFVVREARMLPTKHTIVGAAAIRDQNGNDLAIGLFTLVKSEPAQTFSLDANFAGQWAYHEIASGSSFADVHAPTWSTGFMIVHGPGSPSPGAGCTEADLTFADGSRRSSLRGNGTFG
jgi:hypothetical protein